LSRIEDSRKGGTDYRYDPVGRLIEAISPIAKERFAFDPASNITDPVRTAETPASRPSPVRPESTLPVEVPKVLGNLLKAYAGMHFEYDARGNLVRKRTPAGEQEYEWDEFNRLLSARVAETSRQSQARYFYDAFGRRIAKEVNGARTVFGWDGDTLAYESDGERGTHYLYEPGTFVPLAQYVAGPVEGIVTPEWKSTDRYVPEEDPLQKVPQRRGDAAVFYYHCDQIGTPQLLTDDYGDVVWEASYKAWGEAREVIARASKAAGIVAKNPLRFQGQQVDEETGLANNRYRYYDPSSGRFVSKDPIGLAGDINVYRYAPNPVGWVDPLGLLKLNYDKSTRSWTTPNGLIYGQGSRHGNRVKHVLDHESPNPGKTTHSVFCTCKKGGSLDLVDEAWTKRGQPLTDDPGAYVVPMGRVIGTAGETNVRTITRPGTNEVISAYPVH